MSDVYKTTIEKKMENDTYKEHQFHTRSYPKDCSECYKTLRALESGEQRRRLMNEEYA